MSLPFLTDRNLFDQLPQAALLLDLSGIVLAANKRACSLLKTDEEKLKYGESDFEKEYAKVFDHCYGTPAAPVMAALGAGRDVLFDIDWQGTQQLADASREDLVSVFILPPSTRDLEKRLLSRAQDSADVVASRMAKASDEISHYREYDYILVNADLDQAVKDVWHLRFDANAKRRDLMRFTPGDVDIADYDVARRWRQLPCEALEEGRLASAVGPKEANDFTGGHGKGEVFDRRQRTVALSQAFSRHGGLRLRRDVAHRNLLTRGERGWDAHGGEQRRFGTDEPAFIGGPDMVRLQALVHERPLCRHRQRPHGNGHRNRGHLHTPERQ